MAAFEHQYFERQPFEAFLHRLLHADWEREDGPLRLNPNLTPADLADCTFLANAQVFLSALAEGNGTALTATGNLTRAFVASLYKKLKLTARFRSSLERYNKVVNEQDIWPLHIVRIVCECAGLITRRNKRCSLTRKGRTLATDDQAGQLLRALFVAHFRKFDLSYDFQFREVPGIQQTIAVILWRLETVAQDWKQVKGLAPDLLLPEVYAQLRTTMVGNFDSEEEWILSGYVLNALLDFGLIERKKPGEWPGVFEKDAIRISPLWRKFIKFDWQDGCKTNVWN